MIGGGTVVDAGMIAGGRNAIEFGGHGNLLVLEDGFTLTGGIVAAGTSNVVELRGSVGAAVAASYNALGLSGFQTAAFAPGNGNYATWTITNSARLPGTIAGFAAAGLGVATLIPAAMHGADQLPGMRPGTGLTAVTWLMRVGFFGAPLIVGVVADATSLRVGLLSVPIAGLMAMALAGALSARRRPSRS